MSWDEQAATFDDEPDHGLRDPSVRAAWTALLLPKLASPARRLRIADLGCGTGSISALFAEAGHEVHGVDLSPQMLEIARAKATTADFRLGDAADPPLDAAAYDVVFARHVLWTLPPNALSTWIKLLRPAGLLLLVEGRWSTGAGLTADECKTAVLGHRRQATIHPLTDPALWGGPIDDERYLLVSEA
ncbi:class I SAM-dependent methyltransferase [Kutzneria buriramensis]|uniref:Methyltransferase family protein n=1 Tax=Kutzneria buriramensis TaxID=1045776 RepID=A0A3E0I5N6_9PSEU|nr:class I SAM-dependent methyltransferase [Kutzneria buriramensis]REH53846.1 methyltransferase family protein [Kutzneria buriramensis]